MKTKTMLWLMTALSLSIGLVSTICIVYHIGDVPVPSDEPYIVGVVDIRPVAVVIGFSVFVISGILLSGEYKLKLKCK